MHTAKCQLLIPLMPLLQVHLGGILLPAEMLYGLKNTNIFT